jgi:hypothetical protein
MAVVAVQDDATAWTITTGSCDATRRAEIHSTNVPSVILGVSVWGVPRPKRERRRPDAQSADKSGTPPPTGGRLEQRQGRSVSFAGRDLNG